MSLLSVTAPSFLLLHSPIKMFLLLPFQPLIILKLAGLVWED